MNINSKIIRAAKLCLGMYIASLCPAAYAHDGEKPIDPAEIPALVAKLKSFEPALRAHSAHDLGLISRSELVPPILPKLADAANDPDPAVRYEAVRALGHYPGIANAYVPNLIKALDDSDAKVRRFACRSLGVFGDTAKSAIPSLERRLDDADVHVQHRAIEALVRLGGLDTSEKLTLGLFRAFGVEVLKEDDENDRFNPATVITLLEGATAKTTVIKNRAEIMPLLIKMLGDLREDYRGAAARTIGWFGPDGKEALPGLLPLLEDEDVSARHFAMETIARIGPAAAAAAPALVKNLSHTEVEIRAAAAFTLGAIGSSDVATINGLRQALKDANQYVQAYAAAALGRLGAAAQPALPELRELVNRIDPADPIHARASTLAAISKIEATEKSASPNGHSPKKRP